jgi:O-methyltransferase/methyltransferase family protein
MQDERSTPPPSADEVILRLSMGVPVAAALFGAATLGVADHLASGPKTRDELAAATRTHVRSLYRVLRALASLGVFAERDDGRFENTPASERLRSDVPGSLRDYVIFDGQPWQLAAYGELLHSIRTGEPVVEKVLRKPIWEFFASDAEQGRIFNAAMTSLVAETAIAVRDAYDFSSMRTLVDVGGGHGMLLGTMLAANPRLRGVLFDQPHVVADARSTFERLGVSDRASIVGGDFFAEVPAADGYIMSHIIHDWDDERSIAILRTIRRAMEPGARVVVVESVIPAGNAPSPGKLLDLIMLALPGGIERTEAEYRELFASAGLRLARILPTRSGAHCVEATLA